MSDFNPAISRRAFAQAAAAGVGVAAVSGGWDFLWPESAFADENSPVEERFSYCDMCNHSPKCGITAHVRENKIVRIESRTDGYPNDPLCAKGMAAIQQLYDPERLLYPMKRTNPVKGIDEDPGWEQMHLGRGLRHHRRQDAGVQGELRRRLGVPLLRRPQGAPRRGEPPGQPLWHHDLRQRVVHLRLRHYHRRPAGLRHRRHGHQPHGGLQELPHLVAQPRLVAAEPLWQARRPQEERHQVRGGRPPRDPHRGGSGRRAPAAPPGYRRRPGLGHCQLHDRERLVRPGVLRDLGPRLGGVQGVRRGLHP